jgi:hypothetical protein
MREPIIADSSFHMLFQLFGRFIACRYHSKLDEIIVDGDFAKEFDWAFKIQLIPKTNRYNPVHYLVAGKNALGAGYYLTDYKKIAG